MIVRSIRGTIRQRAKASRLAATVRSLDAPPAMYPNASAESTPRAARSNPSAVIGSSGRPPPSPRRWISFCTSPK